MHQLFSESQWKMPMNWVVQISSQDLWASVLAKRMLWSRNGASRQHEMAKPCPKILPVRPSWTGQQKSPWPGQYFKSSRESGEELPRSLYKENILLLSAGDEKPSTPGSGPDRGFMGRVALTVKAEPEVMERTLRGRRPEPSRCMQFTDLRRRLVWAGVLPSSYSFQLIDLFWGRSVWIKSVLPSWHSFLHVLWGIGQKAKGSQYSTHHMTFAFGVMLSKINSQENIKFC